VDRKTETKEFLASRRARLGPEQAGLPVYGSRKRRVPGLRREEVAMLAGVSVDYYTRLERGNLAGVSEPVLDSLARTLQLDEAERTHLFDLARAANEAGTPSRPRMSSQRVRPSVQRMLDSMVGAPAWVRNARHDFLAANPLGFALYSDMFTDPIRPANNARFVFLNARSQEFFVDWERAANDIVAMLRSEAGRNPYDKALTDLIGELSTRSETFGTRWAAHNVRFHHTGRKQLHHPVVGDLDLTYEAMELPGEDLTVLVYTAEVGSPSQDALDLLASWAATVGEADSADAAHPGVNPLFGADPRT
jgi:transcriptional regulator with XRE-family HTH domain